MVRSEEIFDDGPEHSDTTSATQQVGAVLSSPTPLASPQLSNEDKKRRSSLRLLLARMDLMRCCVLQNLICGNDAMAHGQSEHKNGHEREQRRWNRNRDYEKMHELAIKANALARKERFRDLEVRSEFWLGRSCGGISDDKTALEHFQAAKGLHTLELRLQTLLPSEKEDLDELISYCTQRLEKRAERSKRVDKRASRQMKKQGISSEVNMVHDKAPIPTWAFDHDRNYKWARAWLDSHPLPRSGDVQSVSKAAQPTSHAKKVISQAEKSVSAAKEPEPKPEKLPGQISKLSQPPEPISQSPESSSPPRQPTAQSPRPTPQRSRSIKFTVLPFREAQEQAIAQTTAGTTSPSLPRRKSSLRRKPTLPRRRTRGSIRSTNIIDFGNPEGVEPHQLKRRPTLGRRSTQASSVKSNWTVSSSSSSPEGQRLDQELKDLCEDLDSEEEYGAEGGIEDHVCQGKELAEEEREEQNDGEEVIGIENAGGDEREMEELQYK